MTLKPLAIVLACAVAVSAILVSACEQSGRAQLATLAPPVTLEHWLKDLAAADDERLPEETFVLDPTARESLVSYLQNMLRPVERTYVVFRICYFFCHPPFDFRIVANLISVVAVFLQIPTVLCTGF